MNNTTFPDEPGMNYGGDSGGYQGGNGNGNGGGQQMGRDGKPFDREAWIAKKKAEGTWQERPARQGGGGGGGGGGFRGNGGGGGGGFQKRSNEPEDLTLYLPYAVTGNRETPEHILTTIEGYVRKLETMGFTLRTGGMQGIEELVEKAAKKDKLELHLPFRGFAEKESRFTFSNDRVKAVAKQFQPGYDGLKLGAQAFCNKNVRLVLGDRGNSPALFLLVWTEDGAESQRLRTSKTGFAGHAIAVASAAGIPIFNFGNADTKQRLDDWIAKHQRNNPPAQQESHQHSFEQ